MFLPANPNSHHGKNLNSDGGDEGRRSPVLLKHADCNDQGLTAECEKQANEEPDEASDNNKNGPVGQGGAAPTIVTRPGKFYLSNLFDGDEAASTTQGRDIFNLNTSLLKQKRDEIRKFLNLKTQPCAVVHGPPGSLKSTSVKWAAGQAGLETTEIIVDGKWSKEQARSKINNVLCRTWATSCSSSASKLVVVYNMDSGIFPRESLDETMRITQNQNSVKFIFEMNNISPAFYHHLSNGFRMIRFYALKNCEMEVVCRFLLQETAEYRPHNTSAPSLPNGTSIRETVLSCNGDVSALNNLLRFKCNGKDTDANPMVDTSNILRQSKDLVDENCALKHDWVEGHAGEPLTNWIDTNVAEQAGANSFNALEDLANLYSNMASYDVINAASFASPPQQQQLGHELVARDAHLTVKRVGRVRSPKVHGYLAVKADANVKASFELRGSKRKIDDLRTCELRCVESAASRLGKTYDFNNENDGPELKRQRVEQQNEHTSADPAPTDMELSEVTSAQSAVGDIFPGTTVESACDALVRYSSRPREVVQCRGSAKKLVVQAPKPFPNTCWIGPLAGEALQTILNTSFDAKDERVEKMKKLTLLSFKLQRTNVLDFWSQVAKALGLRNEDGLNVYATGVDEYIVLLYKRDQRKTPGFLKLPGFEKRYVGSRQSLLNNDAKMTELVISVLDACSKMPSVRTLVCEDIDKSSAFDVVAVCRDMDPTQLQYLRLEAYMTKDKDRDDFQRALTQGWVTIGKLTKNGAGKLNDHLLFVTDERVPKFASYRNFATLKWGCFDVACRYYDTDSETWQDVSLAAVLGDSKHEASYRKRCIVLMGKTRDGKSELAKTIARMSAIMHQHNREFEQRKFIFITNAEDFKIEGLASHIEEEVPIIFDDISPGKCMSPVADPSEYMKNLFTVTGARTVHMRNYNANLKRATKIFTTNCKSTTDWLSLRTGQDELGSEHVEAMNARCVFVTVKSRMYTKEQSDERDALDDDDWDIAKAQRDACLRQGIL